MTATTYAGERLTQLDGHTRIRLLDEAIRQVGPCGDDCETRGVRCWDCTRKVLLLADVLAAQPTSTGDDNAE